MDIPGLEQWEVNAVQALSRNFSHVIHSILDEDDLMSIGLIAAIKAKNDFDSTRNMKWKSFLYCRIKWSMMDALRKQDFADAKRRSSRRNGTEEQVPIIIQDDVAVENYLVDDITPISALFDSEIRKALESLPEKDSSLLISKYFDCLSFKSIGKAMKVSGSMICIRHKHALAKARFIFKRLGFVKADCL